MSNTTLARIFGNLFDNDGQVRRTADGRNMLQAAKDVGATVEYPEGRGLSPIVYVFTDGSAVVELDGGWDFRAEGCTAHCWDGVGCDCADRAAQTARDAAAQEADDLIDRSIEHDEIVSAKWTQELEDELLTRCDAHAETGETCAFWGDDAIGGDWLVHLDKSATDEG